MPWWAIMMPWREITTPWQRITISWWAIIMPWIAYPAIFIFCQGVVVLFKALWSLIKALGSFFKVSWSPFKALWCLDGRSLIAKGSYAQEWEGRRTPQASASIRPTHCAMKRLMKDRKRGKESLLLKEDERVDWTERLSKPRNALFI